MYFLVSNAEKTLLCKDGSWIKIISALEHPERVLTFSEAESASQALMGLSCRKNVYVCSDKTLFQKFGIEGASLLFGQTDCSVSEQPDGCDAKRGNITIQANRDMVIDTPLILDTTDILERLVVLIERWDETVKDYYNELNALDGSIQDELHYQEFEQLNCAQGYKAYKRLHELRIARRRLKNEYMVAKTARDLFSGSIISDIQRALSCIDGLKSLTYSPRILWPGENEATSLGLPRETEKTLEE